MLVLIQLHDNGMLVVVENNIINEALRMQENNFVRGHNVLINGKAVALLGDWEVIMALPADSEAEVTPNVEFEEVH